jgi:glycosyltransferase involved in cell wall biosynthesis
MATPPAFDPASAAPRRVARIITRLNIGGPSIQAAGLTAALEPFGFHTRLLHGRLGEGEGDMSYLLPPTADARHLSTLRRPIAPLDDLRALVRIYRELRSLRPAIVHTHMAKAGLLGRLAAVAYNATRGAAPRARIVHTYHGHVLEGYFSPLVSRIFIALERLLAPTSAAIVAISPAIRRELVESYGIGRDRQYRVVPLGFDLEGFAAINEADRAAARRALNLADGVRVIATAGRLTAIKQHELFLDAVARVAARHPTVVALVAGDGERRRELEALAASLGIGDRVRWLGWRRDLATLYAATDVFLLTSRNEGTPVAIIEAMASAVAVVSTDVGGVKDVVFSSEVGLLAPFGDAAALASAIDSLLSDAAKRRAIGARARDAVLQRFGFDRLVDDIARLYRELLERD